MNYREHRYQLGNLIQDWAKRPVVVRGMSEDNITVEDKEKNFQELYWRDVKPLEIKLEFLEQLGFQIIKTKQNYLHQEINGFIIINSKYYNIKGIVYDDKSLWVINTVSVRWIHQLQNLLSIIEPTFNSDIMPEVNIK